MSFLVVVGMVSDWLCGRWIVDGGGVIIVWALSYPGLNIGNKSIYTHS